jgi:hypothetical protein
MQPSWNQIEAIIDYWAADDDETHPRLYANEWEDFLSASRKPSNIRCHLPPAAEDKGQAAARNTICSVAVGCMVMLRYCGAFCGGMAMAGPGVSQDPDALLVGNANTSTSCRACNGTVPKSQCVPLT